jgi:hypothetical protein
MTKEAKQLLDMGFSAFGKVKIMSFSASAKAKMNDI